MNYSQYHNNKQRSPNQFPQPFFSQITNNQQLYYPFGKERSRLAHYVQEQLNSPNTRKNQQILIRFREEAEKRKHHYLRHRLSLDDPAEIDTLKFDKKIIVNQSYNFDQTYTPNNLRFSNYLPSEIRPHSLIPTSKTEPPALRYHNLNKNYSPNLKYSRLDNSTTSTILNQYKIKEPHSLENKKRDKNMFKSKNNNSLKTECKETKHIDYALKHIKQIVKKKRYRTIEDQNPEVQSSLTDSSEMIEELEHEELVEKAKCLKLSRQLKRLKKYHKLLKNNQGR